MKAPLTATVDDYARIFEAERRVEYPVVDAFEVRMGAALSRHKLEDAARVLACEVARWLRGDDCRIPTRATNIARQGVSVALIDPSGLLENGRFGMPEVDAFLSSTRRPKRRGAIVSPDSPRYPVLVANEPAPEETP